MLHRESGEDVVCRMVELLVPRLPCTPRTAELRVRFALQAVFSVLVNAVINDPGPLQLDDERLPAELSGMVTRYLDLPALR